MEKAKCKRCGREWIPRVENPEECPSCKSRYWNKEFDYILTGTELADTEEDQYQLNSLIDGIRRRKQFIKINHEWFYASFDKKIKKIIVKKASFESTLGKTKMEIEKISDGIFSITPNIEFLWSVDRVEVFNKYEHFDIHLGKHIYIKKKDGEEKNGRIIHIGEKEITYKDFKDIKKINMTDKDIDEIRIDSFKLKYTYGNIRQYCSLENFVGENNIYEMKKSFWYDESITFTDDDIEKIHIEGFRIFLVEADDAALDLALIFERKDERYIYNLSLVNDSLNISQFPDVIRNVLTRDDEKKQV